MNKPLRMAFMGTPEFAVHALEALVRSGHEVVCVYCQPPRPAGRAHALQPSPVQRRAEELNLPVRMPLSLRKDAEARREFVALGLDVAVVAAYGLMLPQEVLEAPAYGCINIHASLLPRWRGAAPIQRAVLAGDRETGISIMQMEAGLDTGPVLMCGTVPITDTTTATQLQLSLAEQGGVLIVQTLNLLAAGKPPAHHPQFVSGATYAAKLTKEDGRIDWTQPASDTERQLRALHPWPGVWCTQGGQRLKVLEVSIEKAQGRLGGRPGEILDRRMLVACGTGALWLKKIQPQDRRSMDGASFMNGASLTVGDILT